MARKEKPSCITARPKTKDKGSTVVMALEHDGRQFMSLTRRVGPCPSLEETEHDLLALELGYYFWNKNPHRRRPGDA